MAALQACAGALQAFCLGLAVYIALFRHSTHETPLLYVPHLVAVACVVLIVLSPALLDPSSSSMALLESVCRAAAAAVVTRIAHRSFIEGRPGYRREGVDLAGKIVIVTGANSGIGVETAFELARAGARVIMACRSAAKALPVIEEINGRLAAAVAAEGAEALADKGSVEFMALDLSSLASCRTFARSFGELDQPLHCLVNNAGAMFTERRVTSEGHELTLATNHLGHFLLTRLLLPHLAREPGSRVVVVGSSLHMQVAGPLSAVADDLQTAKDYSLFKAYSRSKFHNVVFAFELHRRLQEDADRLRQVLRLPKGQDHLETIVVNCLNPGNVMTNVMRDMPPWIVAGYRLAKRLGFMQLTMKTAAQGAWTSLYAATSNDAAVLLGGHYLLNSAVAPHSPLADDREFAKTLWEKSEALVGEYTS